MTMEEKEFEEKTGTDIPVEEMENDDGQGAGQQKTRSEEFTVAAEELVETVKGLAREANVRRIIIKNKEKRILFEIPLVMGLAGIALLPFYSALALIAALVAECTITVVRVEEEPDSA